jgi:hypothetical protein
VQLLCEKERRKVRRKDEKGGICFFLLDKVVKGKNVELNIVKLRREGEAGEGDWDTYVVI